MIPELRQSVQDGMFRMMFSLSKNAGFFMAAVYGGIPNFSSLLILMQTKGWDIVSLVSQLARHICCCTYFILPLHLFVSPVDTSEIINTELLFGKGVRKDQCGMWFYSQAVQNLPKESVTQKGSWLCSPGVRAPRFSPMLTHWLII